MLDLDGMQMRGYFEFLLLLWGGGPWKSGWRRKRCGGSKIHLSCICYENCEGMTISMVGE